MTTGVGVASQFEVFCELSGSVDRRTAEILERRRKTATIRRRGWLVRRMLVAADIAGLIAAIAVAETIVTAATNAGAIDARDEVLVLLATLPVWVVAAKLYGLYDQDDERTDHSTTDEFTRVFHLITVCTWVLAVVARVSGVVHPSTLKLVLFWVAAVLLVTVARAVARALARRNLAYIQNTVIVGAGDVGQLIAHKLMQHPEYGVNVVGFIDDAPKPLRRELRHVAVLGGFSRLDAAVRFFDVERVVVAFSGDGHATTLDLLRSVKQLDVQIDIVPRLFETVGPNVTLHAIEGLPLVGLPPAHLSRSSALLKRATDVAVSAVALAVLAPVLVLLSLAVKIQDPGPALYRHRRVGRGGGPIDVLKFRTMHLAACRGERYGGEVAEDLFRAISSDPDRAKELEETFKLANDPRVTRLGRLLRKTSLDELPQLLNVLRGELSLVGPRAVTEHELERYGDAVGELLSVRPGVTGYWQINGRSRLSYEDRVRLDLAYIGGWSMRLDLQILGKTMRALTAKGAAV